MASSSAAKKRQLDEEVAELRRQWKAAKKAADSEAQAAERKAKHWKLDGRMLDIALVIHIWSGCSLEPTVQYLKAAAS